MKKLSKEQKVALHCMQLMVENQKLIGSTNGAWWSIQEAYNVEVQEEHLLMENKIPTNENIQKLYSSLRENNIELFKDCIHNNIPFVFFRSDIGATGYHFIEDVIAYNNLDFFRFILEDPSVQKKSFYKDNINFEREKYNFFTHAYTYDSLKILDYLIQNHHLEFLPEVISLIQQEKDKSPLALQLISIIEKKHQHLSLQFHLPQKTERKKSKL